MTLAQLRRRLILSTAALTAAGLAAGPAKATLTISNGATKNVSCSAGVCAATAKNAVLNAGDLAGMLASSDVAVQSTSKAKDIELKVALSFSSASQLTLDAYRSITFDKPLTVAGFGALTLTTNDGGTGGELSFVAPGRVAFWDLSSSLVIDGASYTLVGDIATLASDIAADASGHYALANNYDASLDGTYAFSPIPTTLTGSFEGLGNAIARLKIKSTSAGNTGFFAVIGSTGSAKHLSLSNVSVAVSLRFGNAAVGALAGGNAGLVEATSVSGAVSARSLSNPSAGGLVGDNSGTIENSHASATVAAPSKHSSAGGLVGGNSGTIDASYATGAVTMGQYAEIGGLVGTNGNGLVSRSFATGGVTASDFSYVGGLAGVNYASIENSYATGAAVGGRDSKVGGLVGDSRVGIVDSYSLGSPTGGSGSNVGGFLGYDDIVVGSLTDDYWNTDTSGITDLSQGAGNISNDPGISGLSTAELQSGLPAGFDPSIWGEAPGINSGFPYLLGNVPP